MSVFDLQRGYHPLLMEKAVATKSAIILRGKDGPKELAKPRLKHRIDLREYVGEGGWVGEPLTGFVSSPRLLNPQRHGTAIFYAVVQALLDRLPQEQLVGRFNSEPIADIQLKKLYPEEEFAWGPYQICFWGHLADGSFVQMSDTEVVPGQILRLSELANDIRQRVGESDWLRFAGRDTSRTGDAMAVAMEKIASNISTLQRTDVSSNHCFGLALRQCGLCIDSLVYSDERAYRISVNRREPLKATKPRKRSSSSVVEPAPVQAEEEVWDGAPAEFVYES